MGHSRLRNQEELEMKSNKVSFNNLDGKSRPYPYLCLSQIEAPSQHHFYSVYETLFFSLTKEFLVRRFLSRY